MPFRGAEAAVERLAVLRPMGSARGRRPLPSTQTIRLSRSTSSRVMPAHSAQRIPVSISSRMMALCGADPGRTEEFPGPRP
jgi:hypothetical protein